MTRTTAVAPNSSSKAFAPMTKILVALMVAATAYADVYAQPPSPSAPVCAGEGLDLFAGTWADRMLTVGTFRLAIDPDTSRGPTTAVTLENGRRTASSSTRQSFLLVEVGDERRTCATRIPFAQCPAASEVVGQLQRVSLPVGLGLPGPAGRLVLHGSAYHLESVDGFGNRHRLKFSESGHPFEGLIERSLRSLQPCIQPVADAYHRR